MDRTVLQTFFEMMKNKEHTINLLTEQVGALQAKLKSRDRLIKALTVEAAEWKALALETTESTSRACEE